MAKEYDVVVLGAGPGGYVAAIRAKQLGLKTAVIEKQYWGGVCLNVGCIPSKALLRNAELVHIFKHEAKTFGINVEGSVSFDYGEAFRRSRKVADGRVKGVRYLMKKNKIDEYEGWATFTDPHTLNVKLNAGGEETVRFKNCIIAAGSTTRLVPGSKLSERVVTYEEQIMEDHLPGSVIIAGAGAVGVEFAYVFNSYGVDVTVTTQDGKQQTIEADKVLQAIGFKSRVEGYGLEKTDVRLTERGAIEINEKMQTNIPHIYAIGDVTAKLMLAHVAEAMGVIAAENIAGAETIELEFDMMPRATYCQPQFASFGYTEKQARERGHEINVAKFPFTANGKAQGLGDPVGFVKLISDKKYGEMLGAHLIGPDVTELLPELTLARFAELTPREIARNVHSHPTLSEAIKEAAHGLEGHMINL